MRAIYIEREARPPLPGPDVGSWETPPRTRGERRRIRRGSYTQRDDKSRGGSGWVEMRGEGEREQASTQEGQESTVAGEERKKASGREGEGIERPPLPCMPGDPSTRAIGRR